MERILDIYKRPYDEKFPVVCYDEMPRQLLEEVREIQPMRPGRSQRVDYEYRRMGTCNVLLASEPLRGWRMADVTQTKTAKDWAMFTEKIASAYPNAEKIILIEDNLKTHKPASWYETFPPEKAKVQMQLCSRRREQVQKADGSSVHRPMRDASGPAANTGYWHGA